MTDSKLSRISSAGRSSSAAVADAPAGSADTCGNRSAAAIVATRPDPDGESGTKPTPSANRAATRRPASRASRVLPTPPGPVSVTSRGSGCVSNVTSWSSCSPRPTKSLTGAGTVHDVAPSAPPGPGGSARNRSLNSTATSAASRSSSSWAVPNALYDTSPAALMASSILASRESSSGAGTFKYTRRGIPEACRSSSSSPETSIPGPTQPYRCQYTPTNTSLCRR